MSRPAVRGDAHILPLPDRREGFDLSLDLTPDEERRVRQGLVPGGSDDRWFLFVEDDVLYCHRSWTGHCVFAVQIETARDGARLTQAWASRDTGFYESGGIDSDRSDLIELIRSHLLRAYG